MKNLKGEQSHDKRCNGDIYGSDGLLYNDEWGDKNNVWGDMMIAVEQQLGFQSSELALTNMTHGALNIAVKIFFYLYSCPGQVAPEAKPPEMQRWFQSWFQFYKDLFKTKSQDDIILTLNRMMKSNINNYKNIQMNQKLFIKTSTLLKLKYEEIQKSLSGGNTGSKSVPKEIVSLQAEGK